MVTVKGGVWTNIEDEVLKAAISKYGLNQWARVSSLLARKTPKQCKARWNEYLDPSIRKIEWSKEEDEKLLHLAKLMPTQWRTIAPIVGRTANQCLERYQRLLDEAEQREAGELGLMGVADAAEASGAPSADHVRKLRPGEVDPDPESKPARPDTIDLDEDEKEMLSEARARLANTQGKKAKRKAREREQEESRRLANLQKRRELKTAGINIKVVTRRQGQMDYNADIPFEKKAAPGFYDTSEEIYRNERQRAAIDPKLQHATNKRKGGVEKEDGDDAGRKKRKNDGNNDKDSLSAAAQKAGQQQRLREAEQSSKRRALVLPTPQVSEGELEEIIKMSSIGERANQLAQASDNQATRGLLQDYSTVQGSAGGQPIRTPRAAPEEDRVANEIRNIRALTQTQSSLLGGENTPLREGSGSTGFETAAPRKQVVATPNPLATPRGVAGSSEAGGGILATPLRPGQTPLRTPRDGFALNGGVADGGETPLQRQSHLQSELQRSLAALPRPKDTSWDMELPDEEDAEGKEGRGGDDEPPEDAADRDRRERERREALEELERKRRTQVVQRSLPRPVAVDLAALLASAAKLEDPAEALVASEAALLMANDANKFPLTKTRPAAREPAVSLDTIDDNALAEARLQVLLEARKAPPRDVVDATWGSLVRSTDNTASLLLGIGCYDDDDEVEALEAALENVRDATLAAAEKGAKLEKKLTVHLGGYKHRAEMLRKKLDDAHTALGKARGALQGFEILAKSEQETLRRRLAALRDEVSFISRREREAQDLYRANREELLALGGQPSNGH